MMFHSFDQFHIYLYIHSPSVLPTATLNDHLDSKRGMRFCIGSTKDLQVRSPRRVQAAESDFEDRPPLLDFDDCSHQNPITTPGIPSAAMRRHWCYFYFKNLCCRHSKSRPWHMSFVNFIPKIPIPSSAIQPIRHFWMTLLSKTIGTIPIAQVPIGCQRRSFYFGYPQQGLLAHGMWPQIILLVKSVERHTFSTHGM